MNKNIADSQHTFPLGLDPDDGLLVDFEECQLRQKLAPLHNHAPLALDAHNLILLTAPELLHPLVRLALKMA